MKKLIFVFCGMALCMTVNAANIEKVIEEEGSYINNLGVEITKENYDKIKSYITDEQIENINTRLYEQIAKSEKVVGLNSVIIETKYMQVGDTHIPIEENVITEKELDAKLKELESRASTQLTTEYKQLWLSADLINGKYNFYIQNDWKKTPYYKSFDVLGLRWDGVVTADRSTVKGLQDYKQFSGEVNAPSINYSSTSGNFKYFYNGVGLSQNLVDDANYYTNQMDISTVCKGNVALYGTYQHAQGDITLADSQGYTLSASGLGNVLYYSNSTIRNTYDNTPGLKVSFTC